jgi:nucleoside-diphosphate-sugar epimerase
VEAHAHSGRVLVTGATGFLGGALSRRLHALGYAVTGTGRDMTRGTELARAGIPFLPADLAEPARVAALCRGMDYVVHCAALASPWGRYQDFYRANVLATRHVAVACRQAGVRRLVHVSSPSICMDSRDCLDVCEDDPLPPTAINAYAATKRLAEEEIDRAHAAGLPVITLRPHAIIGPGDQAIFPRLHKVAARGWFPVIGHGRSVIDVTYVDNAVEALVLALGARPGALGRKFNISNGEPMAMYELLDLLFVAVGLRYRRVRVPFWLAYGLATALETLHALAAPRREPALTRNSVCLLARSRTLDLSAARAELGYRPRVSLAEGIQRFATWWKEEQLVRG